MIEESPSNSLFHWSPSIILTLMVPDTYYSSDDEITEALDCSNVPQQSKQVEIKIFFLSVSDLKSHVRIRFIMLHGSCREYVSKHQCPDTQIEYENNGSNNRHEDDSFDVCDEISCSLKK